MSNDMIIVDLYCREIKGTYKVDVIDKLEDIPEALSDQYKLIRFFMKPLTWKLHTDLIKKATYLKQYKGLKGQNIGMPMEEIDWCLYRQNKALLAISSWNITNEDGEKVEVTDEAILSMNPVVIEKLLDKYDLEMIMTKDKEKALVLKAFKYYHSISEGTGGVEAPPEVVELSLMEKFGWTPQQISDIPYSKIQELFIILNQRDKSQTQQ